MRTYRLSDHYCWRAAIMRVLFALALVLLLVGAGLLYLASRSALTLDATWPLGLVALICLLYLPLGAWRLRTALGSYGLTLSDDYLGQSMRGANDVTVGRDEVTAIIETPGTSLLMTPGTRLVVQTAERRRHVMVFEGLEDYADLRARLAEWRDIKIRPRSPLSAALLQAATLLPAACISAAFWSSNPYAVVPFASVGVAASVACLWMMQRSMHGPTWAKVISWALLVPAALLVWRIAWVCGLIGK